MKRLRLLKRLPYVSVLVLVWAGLRISDVSVTTVDKLSWFIVLGGVVALVYELIKSIDLNVRPFIFDLLVAVVTFGSSTALLVYIWQRRTVNVVDFVVVGIAFCDTWISPTFSFQNALRNVQAGVNSAAPDSNEAVPAVGTASAHAHAH